MVSNAQSSDGLVYIEVRKDHNSPNMQATRSDRSVSSGAASYRVNANGRLEKLDIVAGSYSVVAETYFE